MKLSLLAIICSFFAIQTNAQGLGLNYNYYEGNWNTLPDFHAVGVVKSGNAATLNLNVRNRNTQYGIVWYGSITIPATGSYTFEISSDDGSRLYLGDYDAKATPLIDNDAVHPNTNRTATTTLNAGVYPIAIAYFQKDGDQVMDFYWSSNTGIARQRVPTSALNYYSANLNTGGGGGGINYSYYEGNWNTMPDFTALSPVKTGSSSNFDIGVRSRNTNYALSWKGSITIAKEANYIFETISDDGSKLSIGNNTSTWPVVNNDGLHGDQSKSGTIYLPAGVYNIYVSYFQSGGGQTMDVYWSSDKGLARQKLPDNVLTGSAQGVVAPPAQTPPAPVPTPDPVPVPTPDPVGSGGLTGKNNYYFSTQYGDDSRSSAQAQNPNTPWKTISKLNSIMGSLKQGDAVLFNRGETFDGNINITNSGNWGSPLVFSSYGNGAKPIISGFSTMSNWTSVGNGVWEANCPSADAVSIVTLNGIAEAMGRYPNATDANRGYLTIDDHNGGSSITDYQLSGNTNWTGAEAVVRKNNWVIDRCLVTYHSGNTFYMNNPSKYESSNGYGFFFQNSPLALDQLGEWYFNPSQKKLRMYFGSANPSSYDVKAGVVNELVTISNKSSILFDNLSFRGADDVAMNIWNSQDIHVQNCDFRYSGSRVIYGNYSSYVIIEKSTVNYTNNEGILLYNCSNSAVRANVIKNTGTMPGMGQSGDGGYQSLHLGGSNNLIELNQIDSSGYSGLSFSGDNILIKNNVIDHFTITKDDGGGIYGWGDLYSYNRQIVGNIILNGTGAAEGTFYKISTGASGVMLDDNSANVELINNTIANCSRSGVFIHNSHEVTLKGNTIFDNNMGLNLDHDDISPNNPLRNLNITNNVIVSKKASQLIIFNQSMKSDFNSLGYLDYNWYSRPFDDNGIISTFYKNSNQPEVYKWFDIEGWANAYGYDWHTYKSPVKISPYTVTSLIGSNKFKNGDFNSDIQGLFCLGNCSTNWNWGRLDGGALQLGAWSATNNNVGAYLDMGSVNAGSKYLVKFSTVGTYAGKTMRAFVQKNGGAYDILSETQFVDINNNRVEYEFLFTAPMSAPATFLVLTAGEADCPIYVDNVKIYEANATMNNPDDYIRFEYNPTTNAKSVWLDATYYDVKNNRYSGSVTLDPFTSLILMKSPAAATDDQTAASAVIRRPEPVVETADASKVLDLAVSPNPAKDRVQIVLNAPKSTEKATISITTMAGVTLKKYNVTSPNQSVTVDISSFAKGVYIVNLVYDGKVVNKKFVKQ